MRGGSAAPELALVARPPRAAPLRRLDEEAIGGFLDEPPVGAIEVGRHGLFVRLPPDVEFSPLLDKAEQGIAILVRTLVGSAYTPKLAFDLRGKLAVGGSGSLQGVAEKSEHVADFRGGFGVESADYGWKVVRWLREQSLRILLDDGKLRRLAHARAVELAWKEVFDQTRSGTDRGYGVAIWPTVRRYHWVDGALFADIAWSLGPKVEAMRVAQEAFDAAPAAKYGDPVFDDRITAIGALWGDFNKGADALDAIRRDAALTAHKGYRFLFPAGADASPHAARVRFIELCIARAPELAAKAKEPEASPQRRQLLEDFAADFQIILDLHTGASREGEDALRQEIAKANADPFPSTLRVSPAGPLVPTGGDLSAEITVEVDRWVSLFNFHYEWDLLRIEPDRATETSTGRATMLGRRLSREGAYTWADFKYIRRELEGNLGVSGLGAVTVAASLAIVRFVATVVKDVIRAVFDKPYRKDLVLPQEPGVYLLRCVAGRPDSKGPLFRVPSAAYHLLFVVPRHELSVIEAERALDNVRAMQAERKRLVGEIGSGVQTPEELDRSKRDLELVDAELSGEVGALYAVQRTNLERARVDRALASQISRNPEHVEKAIRERLEEIDRITAERGNRLRSVKGTPYRVRATLVTDAGTMHLMIEAIDVAIADEGVDVFVIDSTSPRSGKQEERAATRLEAIHKAMLSLLQSSVTGYGRGVCTILVPRSGAAQLRDHERATFEVGADLPSLFTEIVERAAQIISALALLAAPFTGGASLSIMIPVGIIGAIPSGYRLAKRNAEGTFAWNLETALDIVNIASAFFGAGQMATGGLRFGRQLASRAFQLAGHGADGLGLILGSAQFFDELEAIANNPGLMPGQRRLAIAMAVANKLMSDGSMIGHALAMKTYGEMPHARMDAASYPMPAGVLPDGTTIPRASDRSLPSSLKPAHEVLRAKVTELLGGREIPVLLDPALGKTQTAEVRYVLDAYGFISEVYLALGERAGLDQLPSHAATAAEVLKFTGVIGKARTLIDWARAFFARDPSLKVGKTRAWEARLELEKLPAQINDYLRGMGAALGDGTRTPGAVDAYVRGLHDQLAEHEAALKDASPGSGRIAAHDRVEPPRRSARAVALEGGRDFAIAASDLPADAVTVRDAPPTQAHVSVSDGGKLDVLVPRRAPDGTPITDRDIFDAVSEHLELARLRANPDPARPWTATDEAVYRGYPRNAEPGYRWVLRDGALALDGDPPKHYNRNTGAFEPGPEPAPPAGGKLRPEDALRWNDVQPYLDKDVSQGTPPGYKLISVEDKRVLRRTHADDAVWPRLSVDETGRIQKGNPASNRLSNPSTAARNFGPIPDDHQLHHLVPDGVVRSHPLFDHARRRGIPPYDLDRKSNLIALPENDAARRRPNTVGQDSSALPLHNGDHPAYSELIRKIAEASAAFLEQQYGNLDAAPGNALAVATREVEARAHEVIVLWQTHYGYRLR
ncbi:MAG: AHH domain-containing protein [Deltaproteobacteria bacterium]|nr:AHH domain-containing protein [Deltaproteobacteria bacterium]